MTITLEQNLRDQLDGSVREILCAVKPLMELRHRIVYVEGTAYTTPSTGAVSDYGGLGETQPSDGWTRHTPTGHPETRILATFALVQEVLIRAWPPEVSLLLLEINRGDRQWGRIKAEWSDIKKLELIELPASEYTLDRLVRRRGDAVRVPEHAVGA